MMVGKGTGAIAIALPKRQALSNPMTPNGEKEPINNHHPLWRVSKIMSLVCTCRKATSPDDIPVMAATDHELLRDYVAGSQAAFATLVGRHLNLVYSAARRQVHSPDWADEVAQTVFTELARAAPQWRPEVPLEPWLYTVTRRRSIDLIRRESRHQAREAAASDLAAMNDHEPEWTRLEPILDEAMEDLDPTDRGAIVLRYFENRSLREVGAALGISDDAAQKRVTRAVDRLRAHFADRGIAVGAGAFTTALSTNAVQAAPAGLAAAISAASGGTLGTAILSAGVAGTTTAIAMTFTSKIALTAGAIALVSFVLHEGLEVRAQRQEIASLTEQADGERAVHQQAIDDLAALRTRLAEAQAALEDADETLVGVARGSGAAMARALMATPVLATDTSVLKEWAARLPHYQIPEMRFLTERDWLEVMGTRTIETEQDARSAFQQLRFRAKTRFGPMFNEAVRSYKLANGGRSPTEVAQLSPYFKEPVEPAILDRYSIVPEDPPDHRMKTWLITENAFVDELSDSRLHVTRDGGWRVVSASRVQDLQEAAAAAYLKEHGYATKDPQKLRPYFQSPEEADEVLGQPTEGGAGIFMR